MKWNFFFALDLLDSMEDGAGKKEENSIRKLKIGRWSWTQKHLVGGMSAGVMSSAKALNFESLRRN